jgi:hypothetical protein
MPLQATPNPKVKQPAKDQWTKNDAHACKKPFDLMQSRFVFRLRGGEKVNREKRCSGYHRNKIGVNRNGGTVDPNPEKNTEAIHVEIFSAGFVE